MKYTIAFEADKHWGAMRPEEQFRSSYILKRFLADYPIDLYVNLGDFFDTKLLLNSKASVCAVRDMHEKAEICKRRGIPMRAIKGTMSHDYAQWEFFSDLLYDDSYHFKYFKTCTVEETLPGLSILYCPEENMNFANYMETYAESIIAQKLNMGCFHGSFDKILPSIALEQFNQDTSTTLVYPYQELAQMIHGPLVAGHWHDGIEEGHMIYVGSYDRWTFGEDEVKGFGLIEYDTETEKYRYLKVPNLLAPVYKTYEVYTSIYQKVEEYAALIDAVKATLNTNDEIQVRLLIRITEILPDTEQQIENLKFTFANVRRVHFTIINQIQKSAKAQKKEASHNMDQIYSYVRNPNMSCAEKIQKYIEQFTDHSYTLEEIASIINPYLDHH